MHKFILLKPCKRTIKFNHLLKEDKANSSLELAFPYMAFWKIEQRDSLGEVFGNTLYCGFSNKEITKTGENELWIPPFPHTRVDGSVCIGRRTAFASRGSAFLEDLVTDFFSSDFQLGYGTQSNFIGNSSLRTYQKWHSLTKENNNDLSFILEVDWGLRIADYEEQTLRKIMNELE